MSNLVLERIKNQTEAGRVLRTRPTLPTPEEPPKPPRHPIDPEELRKLLMNEIKLLTPAPVQEVKVEAPQNTNERIFEGVQDFANWFQTKSESFTSAQQAALNTLVDARNMIPAGCECQKHHRRIAAEDYYAFFWTQNKQTDLPEKIATIIGVSSIIFKKFGEIILSYTKN